MMQDDEITVPEKRTDVIIIGSCASNSDYIVHVIARNSDCICLLDLICHISRSEISLLVSNTRGRGTSVSLVPATSRPFSGFSGSGTSSSRLALFPKDH